VIKDNSVREVFRSWRLDEIASRRVH